VSRRRKPLSPNPAVIPFDGVLVCTGRSRHPQVRVAAFVDQREPGDDSTVAWTETRRWDLIADSRPGTGLTLRFWCTRCKRDLRLQEAKAMAAIDALRQTGRPREHLVLDISPLPF
jgi:hypothetical protein